MSGVFRATAAYNYCRSPGLASSIDINSLRYSRRPFNLSSPYRQSHFSSMSRPDLTLYTAQTPNGIKISIALEELGYIEHCPLLV